MEHNNSENLSEICYHSVQGGSPDSPDTLTDLGSNPNVNSGQDSASSTRKTTNSSSATMRRKQSLREPLTLAGSTHSAYSLISTMEDFVTTVEEMNETILVPCRLMDLKNERTGADLYQFYQILNGIKNDLVWGSSDPGVNTLPVNSQMHPPLLYTSLSQSQFSPAPSVVNVNGRETQPIGINTPRGHVRTPSTVSNVSLQSDNTDLSENNSTTGEDSGIEEEHCQNIADTFKLHLHGLHKCLTELTTLSHEITRKYNRDLGQESI